VHAGSVEAASVGGAITKAKNQFGVGKVVYNVWIIERNAIRFTSEDDQELWLTLPEKKFRDAAEYKGGDKLSRFLDSMNKS